VASTLALTLFSCSLDAVVEVNIVAPPGQDPFAGAVAARLILGTSPPLSRIFPITAGQVTGEIKPAPTEVSVPITVELLDERGAVLARGRTPEVPLSSKASFAVDVLVARVGAFATLPGGLATATRRHTAAVVSRFEVLVAGGLDRGGAAIGRAEVYNLYAFGFETAGSLATPRARAIALPQSGGVFAIFGGEVPGPAGGLTFTSTVEIYDPSARTFRGGQGAGDPRAAPAATALPDAPDQWLVAGGEGSDGPLASALLFDTATGAFTTLPAPMSTARAGHTATAVQTTSGPRVLLFGGAANGPEAELFDPATRTFSPIAAALPGAAAPRRRDHTATLLSDGRVLISGGRTPAGDPAQDLVLYDPRCDDVRCPVFVADDLALLPGRWGHAAHALEANRVLLAAGRGPGGTPLSTAEVLVYDPTAGRFARESTPALASARADFASALLPTGQVLLVGGVDASEVPVPSAELYNPR
jgi:hypothetical protein